jgi:hypothetical protein
VGAVELAAAVALFLAAAGAWLLVMSWFADEAGEDEEWDP